jgi:dTDP-4-dehydrorhamnose reductase
MSQQRILMTGGNGRLGTELRRIMPGIISTDLPELDITRPGDIAAALDGIRPEVVIHAAAYTDVARAEQERSVCWETNVAGTRNIVSAVHARGLLLVHISTDYVFAGTTGMYREGDTPGPPRNYYALSKLVAEELARLAARHLVIRTSFRPRHWPYAHAFVDLFTSQDYIDIIAPEIALAIGRSTQIPDTTLHIATERKSAYELARRRRPDVLPQTKHAAAVELPDDISLDVTRWRTLKQDWGLT